jgi:hypothetical protein
MTPHFREGDDLRNTLMGARNAQRGARLFA